MGSMDDYYIADGTGNNFIAIGGSGDHTAFLNPWWIDIPYPIFSVGGAFQGLYYGVMGNAGYPGPNNEFGPASNDYTNYSGVLGTAVWVTGVAGTSTNNIGVYGQSEEDLNSSIPKNISAGVFGAANTGPGVFGWSTTWNGVEGWAFEHTGVLGVSESWYGVQGASTWQPGILGWSTYDCGVLGGSGPEGTQGPPVPNTSNTAGVVGSSDQQHGVIGTTNANVGVIGFSSHHIGVLGYTTRGSFAGYFRGNLGVTGTKAAVVPFPDGTHRALYCMESPDLWFEDFGTAKLKSGRVAVKLDGDFARVIKSRDYHVFVTPQGDCRGLYVRRKAANYFEIREVSGGKSNISFSYRIVGRRKDIKGHRRFAKIDTRLPLPAARAARKPATPTSATRRAFAERLEKQMRQRKPTRASAEMTARMNKKSRPDFARLLQHVPKRPK
jgi:hypothetical protein